MIIKDLGIQLNTFYDIEIENDFQLKKEVFLQKIKSPSGKQKYKRYNGTPLRYAGGKTLAVGLIIVAAHSFKTNYFTFFWRRFI